MKGLLIKDFCLNFSNRRTVGLFLFICLFMGLAMDGTFIIGYAALLMGMLAVGTLSYDEMDNGFPFLMSLPVDGRTYVREKFLYVFLTELAGAVFGIVVYLVTSLIKGASFPLAGGMEEAIGILVACVLMASILIPIQLKFGSEKSRVAYMVIFGLLFAVTFVVSKVPKVSELMRDLILKLDRMPAVLIGGVLAAAVAAVVILLYMISVRIMEKKEF